VGKEGPNQGRLFLVCDDPACDSFQWASPAPGPRPEAAPPPAPAGGTRTEEGFLADIRDNPDDDSTRLIYADWLDEHGRPARAAVLRAQAEPGGLPRRGPARRELKQRAGALLKEHEEAWAGPLRPFVESWRFGRGLIDEVEVEAGRFAEHADELLRLAPV